MYNVRLVRDPNPEHNDKVRTTNESAMTAVQLKRYI